MSAEKSLAGVRILVTRARKQANALSQLLRTQDASVRQLPLIEIRPPRSWKPLDAALRAISHYDWLILTSVNGAESMFARMQHLKLHKNGNLQKLKIAAIGPATKAAIEQRGLKVHVTPKEYIAEAVVAALRKRVQNQRVLLVRAAVARDVIPRELRCAGAIVKVVEAYRTGVPKSSRSRLRLLLRNPGTRPHIITFTSSSIVRNFHSSINGIGENQLAGIALASVGPVTSATLKECGFRVDAQARDYTMPGLAQAIVRWSKLNRRDGEA